VITEQQMPVRFREIIEDQISIFEQGCSVTVMNSIPKTPEIPIQNPQHWLRIPDVICVFVDMLGSTKLSAETRDASTADAYQLFTGTAVRLFSAFEAPYIDVRGDGVFALFNGDQSYRAIAAAVTFNTFTHEEFVPRIKKKMDVEVGSHLGIDQKTVLVRKLGFKQYRDRTDRQNEVWAGKPVNMAAKLASMSQDNELLVSERFFKNIQHELVIMSCGCPNSEKVELWTEIDVSEDSRFDFEKVYRLGSNWCSTHGQKYCEDILKLDES